MVNEHVKEISRLTSDMVKIPSVSSDPEGIAQIADFVKEWLGNNGITSKKVEYVKGFPVVVAQVGKGKGSVMLNGHMDVVNEGERSSWKQGPYSGRIDASGVYGRGTVDMKSGLAVQMHAFVELADKVDYRMVLTAVSDEETGGTKCSKPLSEKYSPDLVLVAEPTRSELIVLGEKGVFWSKLTAKGRTAHASTPSLGSNAIMLMMDDLRRLSALNKMKVRIPQETRDMVRVASEEFGSDAPRVSFNAGKIAGGLKPNVVADRCELYADTRLPPGISVDRIFKLEREMARNCDVELVQASEPNYTSPSNKYASEFIKVAKNCKSGMKTSIMTGGTDGRFFRYKGIPSITYGPGTMKLMHNYNEWVPFSQLDTAYKVYSSYLERLNGYI